MLSHQNMALFPDFQQRLAVLKELGYIEGERYVYTLHVHVI